MASKPKIIDRGVLIRGVTPSYAYNFTAPYTGFNWNNVKAAFALTNIVAPSDNSGAVATFDSVTLNVDANNNASVVFSLTIDQAKKLVPGQTYHDQVKLTENNVNVVKPVTGAVKIAQDYAV